MGDISSRRSLFVKRAYVVVFLNLVEDLEDGLCRVTGNGFDRNELRGTTIALRGELMFILHKGLH